MSSAYLDTNVFVASYKEDDLYHKEAVTIIKALERKQIKGQTSVLTILEMAAVASRNVKIYTGDDEREVRSIAISKAILSLSKLGLTFIHNPGDAATVMDGITVDMPMILNQALLLAYSVGLRSFDLVHLAAAKHSKQTGRELSAFVTGDSDFLAKKSVISQILETPVLSPPEYVSGIGL